MDWYSLKKEVVIEKLNSSPSGLTESEAAKRLDRYGKNIIKEAYKLNPIKIFIQQFKSFLVYILLFAVIISFLIKQYIDASIIFAIIVLNAGLGFVQQYRSEKSILKLKKFMTPVAKVFRNSKLIRISSEDLVPGDVLFLQQGDKIMADCRILKATNLEINEAILTGESLPIEKNPDIVSPKTILAERKNMLYSGTNVVKGTTKAIVVSTGMSSEFGKIAKMLQEIHIPATPMQKKLNKFAKQISVIIILLAILTFILGVYEGGKIIDMFLTSIALVVSAIPEGLPAIITLGLAFATNSMLRKKVIIRRLPAAETLGSVTIICSDKTGTLTEERMIAREFFCNNNIYSKQDHIIKSKNKTINFEKEKELRQLIKTSILCNNARFEKSKKGYSIIGDPTESAFVSSALDLGLNKKILTEQEPKIKEFSFTSERKMMSILRKGKRRNTLYSKGAPNTILRRCSSELINRTTHRISEKRRTQLKKEVEKLERKGYRVLAFASKIIKGRKLNEENLTFLGFIALLDPPRKEVRLAISRCKRAGINVKMITGDSPLTARAVANEVGISGKIITGQELVKMSDEQLQKEINNIGIFARTEPKQKLRIVKILKMKQEEVAITGDGINDVLALKQADIGIAMGLRGSDVAREVSDMILVDDNFASIVKAVEEGRTVYDNSKKATKFLLSTNFVEIFLIAYSILFRLPLPMLPLQILWINLVTDSFPALAMTKEKGEEVMKTKPRKEKSISNGIFWFIVIASVIGLVVELFIFHYGLTNLDIEKTRTMVMLTVIGFEVLFAFSCKSNKSLREVSLFSNKYMTSAFLGIILLQIILIYTPLAPLFGITTLSLKEWGLVGLASLPGLVLFESWKLVRRK